MYRDQWDYDDMLEERDTTAACNGVLMLRERVPALQAQTGYGPAPLLPTNLSVRTARA